MPDSMLPAVQAPATINFADPALEIEYLSPTNLVAYGRKTRASTKAQTEQLAQSIQTFGFNVPVIVDENHKVLAGNRRVDAARLLGLETIPAVVVAHLTPEKKRAFVIADNRMSDQSSWDDATLRIELTELCAMVLDFDIQTIGFSGAEIDTIVLGRHAGPENGDKVPPVQETPVSQIGDLWMLGEHRLMCGDATDPVSLETLMAGEHARTVFTDPPYNVAIGGHVTSNSRHAEFVMASGEMSDEAFAGFLHQVWTQISAALAPGGLAYFCMDWRHMRHTLESMDGTELELLNLIVWDKTAGGMGSFYRSRHELVFLAKKPGASHLNRVQLGSNGRDRSNVWAYDGVNGFGSGKAKTRDLHPTVKPLAMVIDALLDSTERGDVVLDLFSGSGTTLIAAEESRRRGRAMDLDPQYVDTGVIRWQDYTGKEAILAATGETFAQVRARRIKATPSLVALPAA